MYNKIKLVQLNSLNAQEYCAQITLIKNILRNFGIPANLIGYKYIVEALVCMINSEEKLFLNQVYVFLSDFHKTSSDCIEASIRNAIKKALTSNSITIRKKLNLPESVNLSNSVFLNSLKEILIDVNVKLKV